MSCKSHTASNSIYVVWKPPKLHRSDFSNTLPQVLKYVFKKKIMFRTAWFYKGCETKFLGNYDDKIADIPETLDHTPTRDTCIWKCSLSFVTYLMPYCCLFFISDKNGLYSMWQSYFQRITLSGSVNHRILSAYPCIIIFLMKMTIERFCCCIIS